MKPSAMKPSATKPAPMWRRYLRFFGHDSTADLEDELSFHIQTRIDDLRAGGMSSQQAREEAARHFGNLEEVRRECERIDRRRDRAVHRSEFWLGWSQDLRFGFRVLRRDLGVTAVALFAIALGIGCTTAIFTAVDCVLLRPLPYDHAENVGMIWEARRDKPDVQNVVSPANFLDWKAQNTVFERLAVFIPGRATLTGLGPPEQILAQWADSNFFPVLRVSPARGRLFTTQDEKSGAPCVVAISDRLWQTRFGGREDVVGQTIHLDGQACAIVAVMPAGFHLLTRKTDVWGVYSLNPAVDYRKNAGRYLLSVGRLKPGVTWDQARARMKDLARRIETQNPVFDANWTVHLVPLREQLAQDVERALWVLFAAVGFLLMIACANVANLLLARGATRQREIAIRASLGAARPRIVRQLLTENLLLSVAGGICGVLLALAGVRALASIAPEVLTKAGSIAVDSRVLVFSLALMTLTGLAFGLAPALVGALGNLTPALKDGSRITSSHGKRLRYFFVAAQICLTAILLTGAGLLLRTFLRLEAVDPGLATDHVLTFRVSLPDSRYTKPEQILAFFREAQKRLRADPQIRAASAISYLPFDGLAAGTWVNIGGRPPAPAGAESVTVVRTVLPGYFEAAGIPRLEGRDFTDADNQPNAPLRFIVNRAFVRQFFPGSRPLGQTIQVFMGRENAFAPIVGVVGDVKEGALDKAPEPTTYYVHAGLNYNAMAFVLRTGPSPLAVVPVARSIIQGLDPNLAVAEPRTMDQVLAETVSRQRFSAILLATFAVVALFLAAIGIYGVLSYAVAERTSEIGVRLALGAQVSRILGLVFYQGMGVALAGLGAGILVSLALTRLLKSLLFGVEPTDSVTFVGVALLLAGVAAASIWIPARRATRIDPVVALKYE